MVKAPMANVAVIESAMVKVVVIEITVMESVVAKLSAVRNELMMIEECPAAMPVVAPMAPAPAESTEISKSKSNAERQSDATPKNSRRLIPSGIDRYRPPVNQPRIIGRHVDHLRIGRFNNDCVSLCSDPLLLAAIQVPSLLSVLTHLLNSVGHVLRVVGVGLAQRRTPRQILVHVLEHGRKLRERFYARIPVLFVYFFGEVLAL